MQPPLTLVLHIVLAPSLHHMPFVPAAVLLLILSAASWPATLQQLDQTTQPTQQPHLHTHTDLSTTAAASTNDSAIATATELLSSTLLTLLSLSSSLIQPLPAALDSLHARLTSLSVASIAAYLTAASSSSPPHDHTVPVLLFLLVLLSVLLLLLTCVTVCVWQRYAADIVEFREEWHNTRAQHREKRVDKRDRDGVDGRQQSSSKDSSDRHPLAASAAAPEGGHSNSGGRQSSEHLYGFISRARALSEAEDDIEMRTPTVVVPGRDPFSQLKRRY